jgi:hypothetical protein
MKARRSPRIRISAQGSCKSARGAAWDVRIDDLSQGGCRVDDPRHGLELGSHVQLTIAETGPFIAEVAWRQGDRVGLEFVTLLDRRVLELLSTGDWEAAGKAAQAPPAAHEPPRYPVRRIM